MVFAFCQQTKGSFRYAGLHADHRSGKVFFLHLPHRKKLALILECLHLWQDVGHIKTDCSFNTKHITQLSFYRPHPVVVKQRARCAQLSVHGHHDQGFDFHSLGKPSKGNLLLTAVFRFKHEKVNLTGCAKSFQSSPEERGAEGLEIAEAPCLTGLFLLCSLCTFSLVKGKCCLIKYKSGSIN